MEQHAHPQPVAFPISFSQQMHKMPSTYVYTLFVRDLVPAKLKKRLGKLFCSIACCTGRILHGHVATISKLSPHYVLTKSTIFSPWHSNSTRPSPDFAPHLRDKIWEWPGNKAIWLPWLYTSYIYSSHCFTRLKHICSLYYTYCSLLKWKSHVDRSLLWSSIVGLACVFVWAMYRGNIDICAASVYYSYIY